MSKLFNVSNYTRAEEIEKLSASDIHIKMLDDISNICDILLDGIEKRIKIWENK